MDRVGARNTLIVLLTLVLLTVSVWFVMLLRWATDKTVDGDLLAAGTTLLGLLTGSAVSLGARPKVPAHVAPGGLPGAVTTVNVTGAHPAVTADDGYGEPGTIADPDLGLPGEAEPLPDDDDLHDTEAEDV
jgi:hypothetical protein